MKYFIILDSFNPAKSDEPETSEEILQKAIDEVVAKQLDLGIDIVNDGEIARETYFSHFVKRIKGMNPDNVVDKKIRNGELHLLIKNTCINSVKKIHQVLD